MWQRGIGGSSTPTVITRSLPTGQSTSIAMQNGVYWTARGGGLEYQSQATGYIINGVKTETQTRTSYFTVSYSNGTLTLTNKAGATTGDQTVYFYKVN